jgi:hypothetical protein
MKSKITEFENPSASFRGKPFWSWNGRLDKKEVLRQAKILKEMGFGGYFMHSRVGLQTEYLGKEWFDLINAGADAAEGMGMEAWLYDEDRWPSGSAGGLATKDPALRLQGVRMLVQQDGNFAGSEDVLSAFVMKLEGVNASQVRRLEPGQSPSLRRGEKLVVFSRETMPPMSFYNGHGYLDTTNPAATAEFLRLTHEKYLGECRGRLGTSIKGIFIDEPHRGMISSIAAPFPEPEWIMPWGAHFAESFQKRFGYDIRERLPEVFLRLEGRRISQVKWHYVEHLQQMFLDHFMRPVFEWCDRHQLLLTGHLLHEDSLTSETIFNGSMMRNYPYLHAPGVDMLWEGNRSYWGVKKVVSVARQTGRGTVLSELYGCTGWQFNFQAHKAVGDWQALFGITLRCPHLSWFTMKGEAKRDYPASILHQSAWYPFYRSIEDYFSRIHVFMQEGKPEPRLLVLNPVETVWSQIHQGWTDWLYPRSSELQHVERDYEKVFHWLAGHQIDFDYGDEDHIANNCSITESESGPSLTLGLSQYNAVLVAGMETIRSTTLAQLKRFSELGGRVIFAGSPPTHLDALPSEEPAALARAADQCPFAEANLVATCLAATGEPPVRVTWADNGRAVTDLFAQTRTGRGFRSAFIINTDWESGRDNIRVAISGRGVIEEWNARTGERMLCESIQCEGWVETVTSFPPAGERLFRLVRRADSSLPRAARMREVESRTLSGPYEVALDEPNVLVLDKARWCLDDGVTEPPTEILRIDKAVRERLGIAQRGGDMVQPWFAAKHLPPPKRLAKLTLEFEFDVEPSGIMQPLLAMEDRHLFHVTVNGTPLPARKERVRWVDSCFTCHRISEPLRAGKNIIRLECDFHERIDLEAIFLLGRFGVRCGSNLPIVGAEPERLQPGCITSQGFPFYGAGIRYLLDIPKLDVTGKRIFLRFPRIEGACIVVGEGRDRKVIPFRPYECDVTATARRGGKVPVRVILTRRNTFGPLHQLPVKAAAYHPGSFRTDGKAWSDSFVLYPAGLLAPPELVFRQPQADFGEEKA